MKEPLSEGTGGVGFEGPEPGVVIARGGGEARERAFFPTVEKLLDGSLAVVYYGALQHVGSIGRILYTTSRDGGRTWTDPRAIVSTSADDRDPSLTQLRDGRLLLSWFQYRIEIAGRLRNRVLVKMSEDRGETWSDPLPIETRFTNSATSARTLELPSGELLLPIYGHAEGETLNRAAVARSLDGGVSWRKSDELPLPLVEGVTLSEPALARYRSGRIVALIRSDTGRNETYHCVSDDVGETWTAPGKAGVRWHAPDLLSLPVGNRDCVIATGGDVSGSRHPSRVVAGRVIEDRKPVDHHPARLLYASPTGGRDMSYPSTVELGDSGQSSASLFTVYYDATFVDPASTVIAGTWRQPDVN